MPDMGQVGSASWQTNIGQSLGIVKIGTPPQPPAIPDATERVASLNKRATEILRRLQEVSDRAHGPEPIGGSGGGGACQKADRVGAVQALRDSIEYLDGIMAAIEHQIHRIEGLV